MTYATVQKIVEFLGIGQDVVNEAVGTGDNATTQFYLSKTKVVENTETIRVDGIVQTRGSSGATPTGDYYMSFDKGLITFHTAPTSGQLITADYMFCQIKSSVISQYRSIIEEEDIKQGAYLLRKDEIVGKDSYDRYYMTFRFLADSNLDGTVDKDDFTVYEYDNEVKVDITNEVSEIDTDRGFFKLNTGFPTSERSVMVTYRYAKYPLEEILNDLLALLSAGVARMIFSRPGAMAAFGGMSSWSVNGVSISKGAPPNMEEVIGRYDRIFQEKLVRIKPLKSMVVGDGFQASQEQYTRWRDTVPSRLATRGVNLGGIVVWGGFRFNNQSYY